VDRNFLKDIESAGVRRAIPQLFEMRADLDSTTVTFEGHASVVDHGYDLYGGPAAGGWTERIAPGAFTRTLKNGADVAFLVNHDGLTLARTKSGTMTLAEDKRGLKVVAQLDSRQGPVNDLMVASERGDIDEMSFVFRVTEDTWTLEDGSPASWLDGTQRLITEVNLNKGDVSAVNYGANDAASGGFRTLESAFAELRSGRRPSAEQIAALRAVLDEEDLGDEVIEEVLETPDPAFLEVLSVAAGFWSRRLVP
jgi:HK97 family phage prohead protease